MTERSITLQHDRHPRGPYSFDELAALARGFRTRADFQRAHNGAYQCARRRGWLDPICGHMERVGSRSHRFVYRIWRESDRTVYVGLSHDWKARYVQHRSRSTRQKHLKGLIDGPHEVEPLTDLLLSKDAARMESEYAAKYRADGWTVLNRTGTGSLGSNSRKWTLEKVRRVASCYPTRTAMAHAHPAYIVAQKFGWLDIVFSDHPNRGLSPNRKPQGYWTTARLLDVAKRCRTRGEMQNKHPSAYMIALRGGHLDTIFAEHPASGFESNIKPTGYWTFQRLTSVANGYATRQEMEADNPAAYSAAKRHGFLDKIFAHHVQSGLITKPNGYWSEDRLQEEAKMYATRLEMRNLSPSAYKQAKSRRLTDKIFSNHKNNGYTRTPRKPRG